MSLNTAQLRLRIPVSAGELIDRLTILRIKRRKITDAVKLRHVRQELRFLERAARRLPQDLAELCSLTSELADVNERLWDAEDAVRACEARGDFGPRFIARARSIIRLNDRRSALKRKISSLAGSQMVDEKVYRIDR